MLSGIITEKDIFRVGFACTNFIWSRFRLTLIIIVGRRGRDRYYYSIIITRSWTRTWRSQNKILGKVNWGLLQWYYLLVWGNGYGRIELLSGAGPCAVQSALSFYQSYQLCNIHLTQHCMFKIKQLRYRTALGLQKYLETFFRNFSRVFFNFLTYSVIMSSPTNSKLCSFVPGSQISSTREVLRVSAAE